MRLLLPLLLLLVPVSTWGHGLSDSYLDLEISVNGIEGHWQIGLNDLELAVGLDSDGDSKLSWGEVRQRRALINDYALANLLISSNDSPCNLIIADHQVEQLSSGVFLYLPITGTCESYQNLAIKYQLLFDIDSSHRGVANIKWQQENIALLFSPGNSQIQLDQEGASTIGHLVEFFKEGIWHIWIGLDHVLFLVALLVPVVLAWRVQVRLNPNSKDPRYKELIVSLFKVVTAFTLAHSLTLMVAASGILSLPGRLVESIIAFSVVVTGLNILFPVLAGRVWQIAFLFGLIHGFGFASVLSDLGLSTTLFVSTVLSFNIGVEIGQLVIVFLLVPLLIWLSLHATSRRLTSVISCIAITGFGLLWLAERALDLSISFL